ncbi:MAG: hypothetical protein HY551_00210 [Elusimicrobia bacterium]|nr:hypothetical protein [Elusimicrobiota bacterium]
MTRHRVRQSKSVFLSLALSFIFLRSPGRAAEWVGPLRETDKPVWGIEGGLRFGIFPGSVTGGDPGGPRGLIRIGYPTLQNGAYDLVNFIAIEPVVGRKKGFSELEPSRLDGKPGKLFWALPKFEESRSGGRNGYVRALSDGVERLEVLLRVEKFANGAHPYLVLSQQSDAPGEISFTIHAEPDSAAMDYCILSATMGNKGRARLLWLKDQTLSSLALYPDHKSVDFARSTFFPVYALHFNSPGDVFVAVTNDEENPAAVHPFPDSEAWFYGGAKVTQYWKQPKGALRDGLHVRVNARYTYWQSRQPIPGGVAFENFELRDRFYEGQQFIFGVSTQTPAELTKGF